MKYNPFNEDRHITCCFDSEGTTNIERPSYTNDVPMKCDIEGSLCLMYNAVYNNLRHVRPMSSDTFSLKASLH